MFFFTCLFTFFFLFSLFLFLMKFLFWFRGFVVCKFLMNICMKMCRCFVFPHCPWNVCFIASFFLWLNIEEYCEGYATTLVNFHIFKSFFFIWCLAFFGNFSLRFNDFFFEDSYLEMCLFHRSHGSSRKVGCDFPVYVVVCVVIWVITHVFLEVMREIYADINIKIVRQHLILYKFVDEH